jgi:hypothetical protein
VNVRFRGFKKHFSSCLFATGTYSSEQLCEFGLFNHLFEYTVKKNPDLAEILPTINRNANYKSPQMQNEVISLLCDMVTDDVVADINSSDIPW